MKRLKLVGVVVLMNLLIVGLVLPIAIAASTSQELVVSDFGYYLDGAEVQKLSALDSHFDSSEPVIIQACMCADATRLTAVLDWLSAKGNVEILVTTVTEEEQGLCGKCK